MKSFPIFPLFIFSAVTLYSLSYGMDTPQTSPFVTEILTLTTQCINAEPTHLQDWISNNQSPLIALQLKILGGYLQDKDKTTAPIFLLLNPVAPENEILLKRIDEIEIVEKKSLYHINKRCLRRFRITMVKHNKLIQQELEAIKQSLEYSETTPTARAENIMYAKELMGEPYILEQLQKQRILFQICRLTDENPMIGWFRTQQELLTQYLDIQNQYILINPLLSNQDKNERYKKELGKTELAIKKYELKIKIKRTQNCFLKFHRFETLQKHKKYVEELQKISPTSEKAQTIALISFVEKVSSWKNKNLQHVSAQALEQIINELLDHLPVTESYDKSTITYNTDTQLYKNILATLTRCIVAWCSQGKASSLEIDYNNFHNIVQYLAKIDYCYLHGDTKNLLFLKSCSDSYNKKAANDIDVIIHDIENNAGRFKDISLDQKIEIIHQYFSKDNVYGEYRTQAILAAHTTDAQAKREVEIAKTVQEQDALLKEEQNKQAQEFQQRAADIAEKKAEIIKAQQEKEAQQLAIIKTQQENADHEKEKTDPQSAPRISPTIANSFTDNPIQPSLYEKFINIITAPFRFWEYISDLLWFIHG